MTPGVDPPLPIPDPATRRVAAFDFDGTITRRDVLGGFLLRTAGVLGLTAAVVRESAQLLRGMGDDRHRDEAKCAVLRRVFRGRPHVEVQDAAQRYATSISHLFRPEMLERIAWHRAAGHETVIVSASLADYLRPVAATLCIDHVIAVELATDDEDRLTGEMVGPNVRGDQKAVRLAEWLAATGSGGRTVELWAYGDSSGDRALLAMADHPHWMGRRRRRGREDR